jgi:hypothetical protein
MPSRVFGAGIRKRIKPPKREPMVPANFHKKFAEFAEKKGMASALPKPKSYFGKLRRPS